MLSIEEIEKIALQPDTVVVSLEQKLNLDYLVDRIWEELGLIRIYTKKQGFPPDLTKPFIFRRGTQVKDICKRIHGSIINQFRFAFVWGTSTKYDPMVAGLNHVVQDEDVIQIMTK